MINESPMLHPSASHHLHLLLSNHNISIPFRAVDPLLPWANILTRYKVMELF